MNSNLKRSALLKIILFFILFINTIGFPQQLKFNHLTIENGLSNSVVNCMIEDKTGFLWFGTQDGLNRFDGYNFKILRHVSGDSASLSDNDIWSLFQDKKGNIWVGTQGGILNCFNQETEKFSHYFITKNKFLKGNSITSIYQDRKEIFWIGTYKSGLYKYDIKSGSIKNWNNNPDNPHTLSNKYVTTIYEDVNGNIWVGTYNGLCLLNESSNDSAFTCYFSNPKNKTTLSNNIIWRIYQSHQNSNKLWVGTYNGLSEVDINTFTFSQFIFDENNPSAFSRSVSSVYEDISAGENILWLGTYDGLVKLKLPTPDNFQNKKLQFYRWNNKPSDQNSINNNLVNYVVRDKSGVLWIVGQRGIDYYSLEKEKFSFLSKKKYESIDFDSFEISDVQALTQTNENTIWIGTSSGLFSLKNILGKIILSQNDNFNQQNIWSLVKGNKYDLWIGTYGNGLEHLELNSNKIQHWKGNWLDKNDIGNSYVRAVMQDRNGKVWLGFWGVGVNLLDPENGVIKRWHHKEDDPGSLSYDDVWVIYEDSKGRIWIGTYGGGLNLFKPGESGSFYNWVQADSTNEGLTNNNILSICESFFNKEKDKTILWIGTTDGLNKFTVYDKADLNSKPRVEIEQFLIQNNFQTNTINSVTEDVSGFLWLTTNNGLIKFDPAKGIVNTYTVSDGLQSNEFNPNSACLTKDGEIIIGSTKGINIFFPDSLKQSDYKPAIVLTDFQIFNREVSVNERSALKTSIQSAEEITLSYDQNVFSFQFSSLDYNAPEKNNYAYKMEGFDKDWIYSGPRHFVTYTNLDPGKYIFHVKATNSDGVWNNKETQLSILITPPFWQTWWFRTLAIIAIAGVLYSFYRSRLKRIMEVERLRVKIASDLHDDIGSALTRISIESELLGANINRDDRKTETKRISEMSREIITSMSDVVWSIDSRNDSIESLINRMKDFAYSLLSAKNMRVIFEIENLNLQKKLKVDIRQNIYLIFKESINNSAKYSHSETIKVKMMNENGKFYMKIDDPGTKFSEQKLTGHGLRNMQMRAERIGGKLKFEKENGFTITFTGNEL